MLKLTVHTVHSHAWIGSYTERVSHASTSGTDARRLSCGSTAEVAQNGRLGLSVSGIVPALLFPTYLFVLNFLCVLYGMASHP